MIEEELEVLVLSNMKELDKNKFVNLLKEKNTEEIKLIGNTIECYAYAVRLMYQTLQGIISGGILAYPKFKDTIIEVESAAQAYLATAYRLTPELGEFVRVDGGGKHSVDVVAKDMENLAGLYAILIEFSKRVESLSCSYRRIVEKSEQHKKKSIDLIEQQNEELEACSKRYQKQLLSLMDQFDQKSMSFRITGSKESE